jgi:branched-chain amino acid transport system ATP-binding protein
MTALLAVEDIAKSFGALRAVDGVSFSLAPGEILGIAGPNGSGKSTLFNLITNVPVRADRGRVRFGGREIQRLRPDAICRLGLARTFQRDVEFGALTVRQNALVAGVYGGRGGSPAAAAEQALDRVGLTGGLRGRLASDISTFDRKRLMIASALATGPKLLLLDEPASGLAPPEVKALAGLIRGLRADGLTILLIEHVLPLLLEVSERLIVLDQGRVLAEGNPDSVVRDPRVIEAYLGSRGRRDFAA